MGIGILMIGLLSVIGVPVADAKGVSDQGHTIVLSTLMPAPCISFKADGARILMSRSALEELRSKADPAYQTEDERLALIAGNRAGILLEAASTTLDPSGCADIEQGGTGYTNDAVYLVAQLVQDGQAAVVRDGRSLAESTIVVRDFNSELMGMRSLQFADGKAFLTFQTWIR
ncbi:MAG TPA: hypothetical protein VGO76_08465 [Luteibacter sp.]|jgi:hypothetical protein|nr:hypothetical protein [Luteibacter sp.]